jgi:adenosylcobyric acid synthase
VVQGKAIGHFTARDYYDPALRTKMVQAVRQSYERLASEYEVLVLEGAGSPAEVNLKENDFVNMKMAEWADAACLLVGDIDRGGVFASLIGTIDLLTLDERARIAGFVINKFRGDKSLLTTGLDFLEERTGKKVLGVIPFDSGLRSEEEDAATIKMASSASPPRNDGAVLAGTAKDAVIASPERAKQSDLDIAVILFPRISNFTDFDALCHEPGVRLRYVRQSTELGRPDLLILPGTKATVADLRFLEESGLSEKIAKFAGEGGRVLGICGGYQMMGETIVDPDGAETADSNPTKGLGLLRVRTEFKPEKILRQVSTDLDLTLFGGRVRGRVKGYEIHMGRTLFEGSYAAFGEGGAVHPSGHLAGTYFHGLFDSGEFRQSFLEALGKSSGLLHSMQELREIQYARLARLLAEHLDLDRLRECLNLSLPSY